MRVISGTYRGRKLRTPPDLKIRPTSDRLRETLFNILSNHFDGETCVLDLCAGTGAVGIEALSRGAKHVTFVDKSRKSCGLIEANLDLLEISTDNSSVVLSAAADFIKRTKSAFDIVYFDPPYDSDYAQVLNQLGEANSLIIKDNGLLIVEHFHKKLILDTFGELRRWRIAKQGDSSLSFYHKK